MKRKLLALAALAVVLSLTAVACNDKNDKPADTSASDVATSAPAEDTSTPEESGSTPEVSSSTPEESTSAPEESSSTPEESSSTPEESSSTPGDTVPAPGPGDYSMPFISDVASNGNGTDLQDSDLFMYFNFTYGLGDSHTVIDGKYCLGGVHEMFTDIDGFYAYSVVMDQVNGNNYAFCRGIQSVSSSGISEDEYTDSFRPIGNFYEDDGAAMMGGAGIYAAIVNNELKIVIKHYDANAPKRVANKVLPSIIVDSNKLTLADDGETVYILAGDTLCATIELTGSKDYADIITAPSSSFVESAKVTLASGEVVVIDNTLIAASHKSQVGMAVRTGHINFSSVSILGFSAIEIPEMIINPLKAEKSTFVVGQPVYVFAIGTSTDYVGIYAEGSDTLLNKVYLTGDRKIDLSAGLDTPLAAGTYTIRFMPNDATDVSAATDVETIKIVAVTDMVYNIGEEGAMVSGNCFDAIFSDADDHSTNIKADAINVPAGTTELKLWGWAGFKCETFAFGYTIDDNAPVIKDEFTHVFDETNAESMADKNAIATVVKNQGGIASGRHDIRVDLTGLAAGTYTIRAVAQQEDGAKVVLQQFTITIA